MASPKTSTVIALLRGINVGGKNKLAMAELRSIAAEAGFPGSTTHVQSGNIVLPSVPAGKVGSVAEVLHAAIAEATGLDVPVITRTASEWRAIIDANPFPAAAADGTKLHVIVLDGPASSKLKAFDGAPFAPDELSVSEREVYLSLPDGMGRSKLAVAMQRADTAKSGTARNWRTVLALAELAEA
jgi:uncharacterized protein (DUF1697 family)